MAEILIVDDDPQILRMIKRILGREHDVVTLGSGEACLEAVGEKTPDCLLLDLNLPGMSGMDVLRFLAQRDPDLPVIVLTGTHDVKTAVDAMKAGAFDYLTKPYEVEDLRITVRRAVQTLDLGGGSAAGTGRSLLRSGKHRGQTSVDAGAVRQGSHGGSAPFHRPDHG